VFVLLACLINLRNLFPLTDRPILYFSINVVLLLYISVLCLSFILTIVCRLCVYCHSLAIKRIHKREYINL